MKKSLVLCHVALARGMDYYPKLGAWGIAWLAAYLFSGKKMEGRGTKGDPLPPRRGQPLLDYPAEGSPVNVSWAGPAVNSGVKVDHNPG